MSMHLYMPRKRKQLSFVGVKEVTVPSQAMTLKEIIKRFIRHESLPIKQEGFYEDRMGDLEKMANMDITEQIDRANELRANIASADKRMKEKNKPVEKPVEKAVEKPAEKVEVPKV